MDISAIEGKNKYMTLIQSAKQELEVGKKSASVNLLWDTPWMKSQLRNIRYRLWGVYGCSEYKFIYEKEGFDVMFDFSAYIGLRQALRALSYSELLNAFKRNDEKGLGATLRVYVYKYIKGEVISQIVEEAKTKYPNITKYYNNIFIAAKKAGIEHPLDDESVYSWLESYQDKNDAVFNGDIHGYTCEQFDKMRQAYGASPFFRTSGYESSHLATTNSQTVKSAEDVIIQNENLASIKSLKSSLEDWEIFLLEQLYLKSQGHNVPYKEIAEDIPFKEMLSVSSQAHLSDFLSPAKVKTLAKFAQAKAKSLMAA